MSRKSVLFETVAAIVLVVLGKDAAHAGAFLLEPGHGQIIAYGFDTTSTRAFNAAGRLVSTPSYAKLEAGTYIEYGLADWVTLVAQPSLDHIRVGGPPAASYSGLGETDFGARIGVFRNDTSVLSLQALAEAPAPAGADGNRALDGARRWAGELRALYGRSFETFNMPSYLDAEVGYRARNDGWPDEWRFDLTFGVRPYPKLLLLLQNFNAMATTAGRTEPRDAWHKLQLSGVYDLSQSWSLQIGGFVTVAGLNAGRDLGPFAAVWYRF